MVALDFLNEWNAPTDEVKQSSKWPRMPSTRVVEKTIIFFHDESTYQSNDDQPTSWGTKGTQIITRKCSLQAILW